MDRGNIFAKNHNNGSTSVLAVDDEYDIVNLIKQSLQVNGNKVCAYTDANIALYEISNNFSKIVENIQNVHTDNIDEVQNNISKGQLAVIDSNTIYKETTSGTYIVDFLLSKISRMKQKLQHVTKGAMIFNAPDPFFSHDKYDVFIDFEEKIDKALPDDIGLLCWYKPKWLKKLSLAYTISILTHHKCTVDKQWKYKEWDTSKIIDVVSKGIDNNLGEGSSVLLFQTMKSAYKLNQDAIVYRPTIFEKTLKKLLNKDDANSVINSIFEEIIKESRFTIGSTSNKR